MIVNRTTDQAGPATLTVYFRKSGQATPSTLLSNSHYSSSTTGESKAPEPGEDEKVITIDMKHQRSQAILAQFLERTGAVPVLPTPQEETEMRSEIERQERAALDRKREAERLAAARKEAAMVAQARSEAAAMKEAT